MPRRKAGLCRRLAVFPPFRDGFPSKIWANMRHTHTHHTPPKKNPHSHTPHPKTTHILTHPTQKQRTFSHTPPKNNPHSHTHTTKKHHPTKHAPVLGGGFFCFPGPAGSPVLAFGLGPQVQLRLKQPESRAAKRELLRSMDWRNLRPGTLKTALKHGDTTDVPCWGATTNGSG